ncbi:MAG: hypothetical protein JWM98_1009 [Thermoleophilia bacterium]|nr:hypothetical protein [Thermoleophilia bacterium]
MDAGAVSNSPNTPANVSAANPDAFDGFGKAVGDAARWFVNSPLTTYGLVKGISQFAHDHPEAVQAGAKAAVDVATTTNPVVAGARAIADPDGTKKTLTSAAEGALDVASFFNPLLGVARHAVGKDAEHRAVSGAVSQGVDNFVDTATVLSPAVAVTRAIADPEGAKQTARRVGERALDAASVLVPAVGITRWLTGSDSGRKVAEAGGKAVEAGAKGAVDAATVSNPVFALGRAVVDPEGTKDSFRRAGQAAKDYVESPATPYGAAKHVVDFAKDHPKETKKAAEVAFDIATITNPGVAIVRGISSIFD